MANRETQWAVQNLLGLAIQPYDHTFVQLDAFIDRLDEDEDAEALEYVRQFFLPQEEGPGQLRQAADRVANAIRWSVATYGEVPPWLLRAGVPTSLGEAIEAPAAVE